MIILTAAADFADLAHAELVRAEPDAYFLPDIGPGMTPVRLNGRFLALAERWRQQPPIFVRHICPVQTIVSLAAITAPLAELRRVVRAELIDLIDPGLPFSVQTRILAGAPYKPFDINHNLAQTIQAETGAPLDVRQPAQILSVVVTPDVVYLGWSLAIHNLSDWAGGARRLARREGQISRAEFKLLEALAVFQIRLPPRGIALDLGAAPGGWTHILRQHEQYVTAVDPAELHPRLQADKNVRHKQMSAEAYLAQHPDQFDLIVNDMRLDGRDSARLMLRYAPHLYEHGLALMTLKLPRSDDAAGGRAQVIDHSLRILRRAYQIANARQLFHNRSEITIHLTKIKTFG